MNQKTKIYSKIKYLELDCMLGKHRFLSKENLPGAIDAYIFNILS